MATGKLFSTLFGKAPSHGSSRDHSDTHVSSDSSRQQAQQSAAIDQSLRSSIEGMKPQLKSSFSGKLPSPNSSSSTSSMTSGANLPIRDVTNPFAELAHPPHTSSPPSAPPLPSQALPLPPPPANTTHPPSPLAPASTLPHSPVAPSHISPDPNYLSPAELQAFLAYGSRQQPQPQPPPHPFTVHTQEYQDDMPDILAGQLLEMGFSMEQVRRAFAALQKTHSKIRAADVVDHIMAQIAAGEMGSPRASSTPDAGTPTSTYTHGPRPSHSPEPSHPYPHRSTHATHSTYNAHNTHIWHGGGGHAADHRTRTAATVSVSTHGSHHSTHTERSGARPSSGGQPAASTSSRPDSSHTTHRAYTTPTTTNGSIGRVPENIHSPPGPTAPQTPPLTSPALPGEQYAHDLQNSHSSCEAGYPAASSSTPQPQHSGSVASAVPATATAASTTSQRNSESGQAAVGRSLHRGLSGLFEEGDKLVCKICLEAQACIALAPCGHLGLCEPCSGSVMSKVCPFCRKDVTLRLRVFYP